MRCCRAGACGCESVPTPREFPITRLPLGPEAFADRAAFRHAACRDTQNKTTDEAGDEAGDSAGIGLTAFGRFFSTAYVVRKPVVIFGRECPAVACVQLATIAGHGTLESLKRHLRAIVIILPTAVIGTIGITYATAAAK